MKVRKNTFRQVSFGPTKRTYASSYITPLRAVDSISKLGGPSSKESASYEAFTTFTYKTPKNRVGHGPLGPHSSYSPASARVLT